MWLAQGGVNANLRINSDNLFNRALDPHYPLLEPLHLLPYGCPQSLSETESSDARMVSGNLGWRKRWNHDCQ